MKNIFYSNAKNIKLRNNYIKKAKTDDMQVPLIENEKKKKSYILH